MIIFTVTNTVTNQVYVGSTRNDLEDQWDKMVAAADQNLDYPLYRDIRTHGTEAFSREIYDMAENRAELAELEQDAVDSLGAISLRGHKTSTVIIKKKAPVRRKKSAAEKELLDLLDSFASDSDSAVDDLPTDDTHKKTSETEKETGAEPTQGRVIKAEPKAPAKPQAAKPKPAARKPSPAPTDSAGKFDALAAAKAIIAQAAREEEKAAAKAAAQPASDPKRTSRTTGNVKLDLNIDDTINAQLAAITAAVDGVLSGNTAAASQLETQSRPAPQFEQETADTEESSTPAAHTPSATLAEPAEEAAAVDAKPTISEVAKVISGKERRIMDAMERHREARAKRTSDVIDSEKAHLQELLAELNNRIDNMPSRGQAPYH